MPAYLYLFFCLLFVSPIFGEETKPLIIVPTPSAPTELQLKVKRVSDAFRETIKLSTELLEKDPEYMKMKKCCGTSSEEECKDSTPDCFSKEEMIDHNCQKEIKKNCSEQMTEEKINEGVKELRGKRNKAIIELNSEYDKRVKGQVGEDVEKLEEKRKEEIELIEKRYGFEDLRSKNRATLRSECMNEKNHKFSGDCISLYPKIVTPNKD